MKLKIFHIFINFKKKTTILVVKKMSEENTTMNESQFSLISESLESADSECLSALSKKSAILKKTKC